MSSRNIKRSSLWTPTLWTRFYLSDDRGDPIPKDLIPLVKKKKET